MWVRGTKPAERHFVKLLISTAKVVINSKDETDWTPLSWAAESGQYALVKLLIETEGVDVNSKDSEYWQTPLSSAAERGHEEVVKLLISTAKMVINSRDKLTGHHFPGPWQVATMR